MQPFDCDILLVRGINASSELGLDACCSEIGEIVNDYS